MIMIAPPLCFIFGFPNNLVKKTEPAELPPLVYDETEAQGGGVTAKVTFID